MASYGWTPAKTPKPKGKRKAARQVANSAKPYTYWSMDPKTRPKVPDAILKRVNPTAYKQRTENRYMASPITEGSSVTNRDLDRDTKAATGVRYGYADSELQKRYAQSDAMMQQIPQWFDYYRGQLQQLGLADAAAAQYATDQITGLGGTMAAAASKAATQDQAAMAQDAAIRGATVDPQAAVRAQQAAAVNTADLANQAALQTQLGYNSGQYFRGQEGVSEQAKVQQRLAEIAYRRNQIDPDAAQLAREKGDYGTTYRSDRVDKERQAVLENAAFGLDVAKANQSASDAATKRADQRRKEAQDFKAKMGISMKRWNNMTPAQRLAWQRKLAKAKNPPQPRKPETPSSIAKPPSNYTGSEADWNGMSQPARDRWVKQHPTGSTTKKPKDVSAGPGSLTSTQEQRIVSQVHTAAGLMEDGLRRGISRNQIAEWLRTGANPSKVKITDPRVMAVAWSLVDHNGKGIGPTGIKNAHSLGIHVNGNWRQLPYQSPRKPKGAKPSLNRWTIEPPKVKGR